MYVVRQDEVPQQRAGVHVMGTRKEYGFKLALAHLNTDSEAIAHTEFKLFHAPLDNLDDSCSKTDQVGGTLLEVVRRGVKSARSCP